MHPAISGQITFLYTDNLEKSATFYENILGLSLWLDQGTCRIYHITQGSYIGVCQTSNTSKGKLSAGEQNNIIFTIVTDDVDNWYQHLVDKGIRFEKPPETNPTYNIYHCFLRDPNGYLIEIQHFLTT